MYNFVHECDFRVMDIPSNPKRRKQLRPHQRVCPHCDQIVSYKTFRKHKRLYFNVEKGRWFRGDAKSSSESEVDRGDEEVVYESNPGDATFESDRIESSPPHDEPQSLEDSEESPPLSEPAYISTSGSCPTTDGQYRTYI